MANNVENWKYKSKAELEALTIEQLKEIEAELIAAFKMFREAGVKPTDEMVWQLMVVPAVRVSKEGENKGGALLSISFGADQVNLIEGVLAREELKNFILSVERKREKQLTHYKINFSGVYGVYLFGWLQRETGTIFNSSFYGG